MDEALTTISRLEAELRAVREDNERLRSEALAARERALEFAARCDALEVEREARDHRLARASFRIWPFGHRPQRPR